MKLSDYLDSEIRRIGQKIFGEQSRIVLKRKSCCDDRAIKLSMKMVVIVLVVRKVEVVVDEQR